MLLTRKFAGFTRLKNSSVRAVFGRTTVKSSSSHAFEFVTGYDRRDRPGVRLFTGKLPQIADWVHLPDDDRRRAVALLVLTFGLKTAICSSPTARRCVGAWSETFRNPLSRVSGLAAAEHDRPVIGRNEDICEATMNVGSEGVVSGVGSSSLKTNASFSEATIAQDHGGVVCAGPFYRSLLILSNQQGCSSGGREY